MRHMSLSSEQNLMSEFGTTSRSYYPDEVREIHALTPSPPPSLLPPPVRGRLGELWDSSSRSSTLSLSSSEVENFTSMSREFNALVVAGTTAGSETTDGNSEAAANLRRIREEEPLEETNPLAIVPDSNPIASPRPSSTGGPSSSSANRSSSAAAAAGAAEEVSVHRVKKEEVESKIGAWQTAEIAKINNRFKREDVIINVWENEHIEKAAAKLKKIERKIEEKRARAIEKMQNDVARARRKAEEKRASAEAKRGTKVAKILELSNLLRAVGRAPSKRSIF